MNPLQALQEQGQSVWLDYIRRNLLTSGEFSRLITEDGLRGVTSNPSIFEKAITGSTDYTEILRTLAPQYRDPKALFEQVAIHDIQDAADLLRPVYEQTHFRDGYVSLEVSPYLAGDTQGTLEEARRLWRSVGRDNLMIKVPATSAGIPAVEQLISEGININVTLLFAQETYTLVAQAYLGGLTKRAAQGGDVSRISSVASFFISRIDTAIDDLLTAKLKTACSAGEQALLRSLMGKVAIANGKLAYQRYQVLFRGETWKALAAKGAQTQRVLWASTSTKNPTYRDVLYVEELIGPDTVNTIPPATFEAFRDHGCVRPRLMEGLQEAEAMMDRLAQVGISMTQVTEQLVSDGVHLFAEAFDKLLVAVGKIRRSALLPRINRQTYRLPNPLAELVTATLETWRAKGTVRRLWARDATLWTGADEGNWLGWLGITEDQLAHCQRFQSIAKEVRREGFTHALLLGMGGSSLCPEVMSLTFGHIDGFPEFHVLDSSDPAQIRALEKRVDLAKTLFIVSSKSGGTLEPNIFKQYLFHRVTELLGEKEAGNRFFAITDPGSKLQHVAEHDGFRHIFFGLSKIGGRYSALSDFGMIPAAIMGMDVPKFLDRAEQMVQACSSCVPVEENPGAVLGLILGVAHNQGRDKVTLVVSPGISGLGAWLEQLLAESTGKSGKGLIPVDRESLDGPAVYGQDRLFVYVRLESAPDEGQDEAVKELERSGQPVVRIAVDERYDLGEEFFRWELATAIAGAMIGINPFNQPDVEASKLATSKLTSDYEQTGTWPSETPLFEEDGIKLYTDEENGAALKRSLGRPSLVAYLRSHVNRLQAGDYFALLGYLQRNQSHENILLAIRHAVRDAKHVATCLGFGPRFLHSTGQAYKGGANTGVFLQITCDDAADLPVPGQRYTFGLVKAAQARGDFQVLAARSRRVLRLHLGADVQRELEKLARAMTQALV